MTQPDGTAPTGTDGTTDEDDAALGALDRDDTPTGAKPVIGATAAVDVGGTTGSTSVLARSDTGARRTCVDTALAAEVGAGPIRGVTQVRSAGPGPPRTRPVVDLVVGVDGHPHVVSASVEDRSEMRYPLLLGRDVLSHYHVDPRRGAEADAAEGGGT